MNIASEHGVPEPMPDILAVDLGYNTHTDAFHAQSMKNRDIDLTQS